MVAFKSFFAAVVFALASMALADGDQKFAEIGNLKLVSGETIKDCKVGYRTFGKLDAARDNAVLVPTWFLGTTDNLKGSFGPGGLVDSSKYYVIAVDALGNGVSTSPSNSRAQHDKAFPTITIRDMVASQHQMLLGLGIKHLRAVLGVSMGGIQSFQWMTAYPDFVDKAIPIVGSPRPTSYDLMFYDGGLKAMKAAIANRSARKELIRAYADFFWLALNTPAYYVKNTKRDEAIGSLTGFENAILAWDPYDVVSGLSALSTHDIFKEFGESETATIAAVHAKLFVIVASQDHCVNPAPALDFAKLLSAPTLILTDDNGHSSPWAEMPRVSAAIDQFLAQ